jgi:hypothetical protein
VFLAHRKLPHGLVSAETAPEHWVSRSDLNI